MRRRPSRYITYFDIQEALAEAGCVICRLTARSVDRYLRAVAYEGVTDPGFRERLRASRGFCREHCWQFQRRCDRLGIAVVWEDLLSLGFPQSRRSRRKKLGRERPPCPACEIESESQHRYISTLVEHLEAGELKDEYLRSAGLCLPHLEVALAESRSTARHFLIADETEKVARLRWELRETIRKYDYRYQAEPRGAEVDAWIRATRKLAGEPPEQ